MHKGVPFDPIVLTPSEVEARLKVGDQFIEENFRERSSLLCSMRSPFSEVGAGFKPAPKHRFKIL